MSRTGREWVLKIRLNCAQSTVVAADSMSIYIALESGSNPRIARR